MTELVTGEAVVLDVPVARFPSRIAALVIDLAVQYAVLVCVLVALFAFVLSDDAALDQAAVLTAYVAVVVGYSVTFETLSRGRTLGKMALGLRVVSDDGGPERFRQALIRGLTGAVEVWTLVGAPIGLITSILSARGKRLGDMFAGTYVIQERVPRRAALDQSFLIVPPPLAGWAQLVQVSGLSDQLAEAAGSYLRRYYQLTEKARADLGLQLAGAVLARVSPPPPAGTPPTAFLTAVLAVRRRQEEVRLAGHQRLIQEAERQAGGWLGDGAGVGGAGVGGAGAAGAEAPGAGVPGGWALPGAAGTWMTSAGVLGAGGGVEAGGGVKAGDGVKAGEPPVSHSGYGFMPPG
jgi:uncharacterized RDD family membrane protein YckC